MLLNGLQSFSAKSTGTAATARIAEGERRHVAALFLDLKDFTSLSESMDHEAVHSLIGGVMRVLADVVDMYGGYVDKIEGDRIMALFGAKKAGENDSTRAVSCAMAMLRVISGAGDYLSKQGIAISARAGIAGGTVTVAPDALGHLTAMGDTINLASRLESLASEGTVLVSGRVRRECGEYFTWADCGERSIRGRVSNVRTWVPLGPGPVQRGRWKSSENIPRAPLTGRSRELEILDDLFRKQQQSLTGKSRLGGSRHILVNVSGPAGIGKSRLIDELLEWRKETDCIVLRGYARSFAQPPFDVWLSLLRNLTGIEQGDPEAGETLKKWLEELAYSPGVKETGDGLRGSIADLSVLLSLEEEHGPGSDSTLKHQHLQMVIAIRNLIRALAEGNRLVIVLENMQSGDSASFEALSFLLSNCSLPVPLMIICLTRPLDENLFPFIQSDYCKMITINLQPLSQMDCKGIIRSMTGSDLPEKAVEWLYERSGGNPFYLIELIRYLVDSGRLERRRGEWILADPVEEYIPDSLSGLIRSRIDRMDPALRRVLQYCSVLGQEFTSAHYKAYHKRAELPGEPLSNLEGLAAGGFLEKSAEKSGTLYTFSNPLFCASAYDTILHFNRRTLHRMAAESAVDALGDHSFGSSPEIACHYENAGSPLEAVQWGIKAMDLYMSAYRNQEVRTWADRLEVWITGLEEKDRDSLLFEVLQRLETTLSTTGCSQGRKEVLDRLLKLTDSMCCEARKPWVLKELGGYYYIAGNPGRASSFYSRALSGARDQKDNDLQAGILIRLGEISSSAGDVARAEDYYSRALEASKKTGALSVEASALIYMGTLSLNRGNAQDALRLYSEALAKAEQLNRREMRMNILANIGMTHSILENGDEALEHFQMAHSESIEMGNRVAEGAILGNMGILHQNRGNMDLALNCFESALEIARETGNLKGEGIVLGNLGTLHNHQGRLIEARECYSRSLELRRKAGNRRGQAVALLNMGSLDLELGSIRSARNCFDNALDIARETESAADEAVALGNLGLIHLRENSLDEAEAHARASIAISERTMAKKNLISSLHTLGLVLIEKNDREEARKVLDTALKTSVETGNRQQECIVLSALGWLDICEKQHGAAEERYSGAKMIIDELELGRKDMEMFIRLREGLLAGKTCNESLDLPGNWI